MSPWLIIGVGLVYLWIAGDLWWYGKTGMALAFFGYALANVGLYMAAVK